MPALVSTGRPRHPVLVSAANAGFPRSVGGKDQAVFDFGNWRCWRLHTSRHASSAGQDSTTTQTPE